MLIPYCAYATMYIVYSFFCFSFVDHQCGIHVCDSVRVCPVYVCISVRVCMYAPCVCVYLWHKCVCMHAWR